eukprot:6332900-Alexandrium_andersonii.AAC.1
MPLKAPASCSGGSEVSGAARLPLGSTSPCRSPTSLSARGGRARLQHRERRPLQTFMIRL